MKHLVAIVLLISLATACTSETSYGPCIGINDDPDPNLTYKVDTMNVVWSVIFFEMIFPPIVFFVSDFKCPVGKKNRT